MRNLVLSSLLVSMTFALGGCLSLHAVRPVVDTEGGIRVQLKEVDDDVFKLEVINYGQYPIIVDRDRVVLVTSQGPQQRVPGGIASIYSIPAGGHHAVHVRYKLGGIQNGDHVCINLAGAVTYMNGQPVPVPPLEFVAE
jgi:hypothetical protein